MSFHFQRGTTIRSNFLRFSFLLALPVLVSCSRGPVSDGETDVEKEARSGEAIYRKYCLNCHQGGLVDSPVLGKKEDWEDRLDKGREALIENVHTGLPPGMPKKGGCSNCTDEELAKAVDYMLQALEDEITE